MNPTTTDMPSSNVTVQVALPATLLAENGISRQEASAELLRAYVLSLYRRDRISTGKAARLLGVDRLTFIRILAEERIPYLDYTVDELDAELMVASQWPQAQLDHLRQLPFYMSESLYAEILHQAGESDG